MKQPPFIYTLHAARDSKRALQATDLHFPPRTGGSSRKSIVDFLKLYDAEFIQHLEDDPLALIITNDHLLSDGFFLKDDVPIDMLYHPCTDQRLSHKRIIDIFFIRNIPNYYSRVRIDVPIWANFGHIFNECLKGACSPNCLPISITAQYNRLYSELAAASPYMINHDGVYNESKDNWYIDGIIYIPNYVGDFIYATHLYCLWLTNRIPMIEGNPLFKPIARGMKEHFLTPYLPMEGELLRNVHCILIDNREHSYEAL
jgi:hypothetical protein